MTSLALQRDLREHEILDAVLTRAGRSPHRQNQPEIAVLKRQIAAEWRGGVRRERRSATLAWTSGHIGATAEPSLSNTPNARVAPGRPEKDPHMTGGPVIRGLRWWAILGLNQ